VVSKSPQSGELQLIDLTGKVILSQKTQGLDATLDVHDLPSGMYMLKLVQAGKQGIHRLVVAH
jgi:hypothetical protein